MGAAAKKKPKPEPSGVPEIAPFKARPQPADFDERLERLRRKLAPMFDDPGLQDWLAEIRKQP